MPPGSLDPISQPTLARTGTSRSCTACARSRSQSKQRRSWRARHDRSATRSQDPRTTADCPDHLQDLSRSFKIFRAHAPFRTYRDLRAGGCAVWPGSIEASTGCGTHFRPVHHEASQRLTLRHTMLRHTMCVAEFACMGSSAASGGESVLRLV